jgi:hypothetical protein
VCKPDKTAAVLNCTSTCIEKIEKIKKIEKIRKMKYLSKIKDYKI